jgi:hypothetical protein
VEASGDAALKEEQVRGRGCLERSSLIRRLRAQSKLERVMTAHRKLKETW